MKHKLRINIDICDIN